jgi:hypothetical protein
MDSVAPSQQLALKSDSTPRLWIACIAAFGLGVGVMLMYQPLAQAEGGDDAIWDYVAQCIVRGQVPYRDVIEIKTPGSAYLSALAMMVGKTAGFQDIQSVRVLYVVLVGILCTLTLLTAHVYLRSLWAGVVAVLILLTWPGLSEMMVAGTRPKVPMIIFGLTTLLLVANDKPFWAGLCSILSFLCWQPGLLFSGAALLVFSRYLTTWRDLRGLKVMIGASVPLGFVLIYFYSANALGDFWNWTVAYNYQVYMPEGREDVSVSLNRLWFLLDQVTGGDTRWVKFGAAGLLIYGGERIWAKFKTRVATASDLFKDALIIVPLPYLVFKMINYPGTDDLIPLFPFIGLFAAYLFTTVGRVIGGMRLVRRNKNAILVARWIPALPAAVLMVLVVRHGVNYRITSLTLQDQQRMVKVVSDLLGADDKIYVHGTLEILVLLNRSNMNPYIFMERGKDRFISSRTPGGIEAVIDGMKAEKPKLISLSRLRNVGCRDVLTDWAAQSYEKVPLEFAHNSVYVRKNQE